MQTGREKGISPSKPEGQVIARKVRFGKVEVLEVECWKDEVKSMNYQKTHILLISQAGFNRKRIEQHWIHILVAILWANSARLWSNGILPWKVGAQSSDEVPYMIDVFGLPMYTNLSLIHI